VRGRTTAVLRRAGPRRSGRVGLRRRAPEQGDRAGAGADHDHRHGGQSGAGRHRGGSRRARRGRVRADRGRRGRHRRRVRLTYPFTAGRIGDALSAKRGRARVNRHLAATNVGPGPAAGAVHAPTNKGGTSMTVGEELRRRAEGPGLSLDDSILNRLLSERIIFLGSEVTDEVANRICSQLLLLNAEDPERDIHLWINSPGGSVHSGMAVYDIMQYVENDVVTTAMGMAASMGQLLLCAGTKGKRYALPHARIMMHQPSGGVGGTAADIAIQAEQMIYTKKMFQERVAYHTGQTMEQIEADSDRDRWFTAQEALAYGFIDKVITGAAQVPKGAGTRA